MTHRSWTLMAALAIGLAVTSAVPGQTLNAVGGTIMVGEEGTAQILLDTPQDLAGFSYGLCESDPGIVEIDSATDDVVPGTDLEAVNGGGGPDFFAPAATTNDGHTVGCVVSFTGMSTIPTADGQEMAVITFQGAVVGTSELVFCDTLGMPPVQTTVVDPSGAPIIPTLVAGMIEVSIGPPPFKYIAPTADFQFDPLDPGSSLMDFDLSIADSQDAGIESQGFSYGLAIGDEVNLTASAATGVLASVNGGDGPDFFGENLAPAGGPGYTLGVVVSFSGADVLVLTSGGDAVVALTLQASPADPDNPGTAALTWTNGIGMPPVENTVVVGGLSQDVEFCDGLITLIGISGPPPFIRADCNDDGIVNIADGIHSFSILFNGQAPFGDCVDACDSNADDKFNMADPVYTIQWRLQDGPPPPAPFPDCGSVPMSALGCNSYGLCP